MSLVWINGQLVDKPEAKISVFDHGFLYGDGVWEHFRAFNGKLFQPKDPVKGLFRSAIELGIVIPLSPDEVIAAIEATLRANDRSESYIRAIVTRGPGTLGPDPRKLDPRVIVIAEDYHPFPRELYEHGLDVACYPLRLLESSSSWIARTVCQVHIVEAKRHALKSGCYDSLLIHENNLVAGSTEGDVFVVRSDGVTEAERKDAHSEVVVELLKSLNIERGFCPVDCHDLCSADEAFLAGTSCGVIGIVQVDGEPIGTGREGPITKRIREAYRKLTRGEA